MSSVSIPELRLQLCHQFLRFSSLFYHAYFDPFIFLLVCYGNFGIGPSCTKSCVVGLYKFGTFYSVHTYREHFGQHGCFLIQRKYICTVLKDVQRNDWHSI